MRSFLVSVLSISIFFIGLSALIREANARFSSDDKSIELIKKSREAIGGQSNIDNVKAMTITGEMIEQAEKSGSAVPVKDTVEINFQLPNRFSKSVLIGSKDEENAQKRVERIIIRDSSSGDAESKDKKKVVRVIKSDGDPKSGDEEIEEDKIVFKKKDGTVEELGSDGKRKVFVIKDGETEKINTDGKRKIVIRKKMGSESSESKAGDGKKVIIEKGDEILTDDITSDGRKTLVRKGDGKNVIIEKGDEILTDDITSDGKRRIVIRKGTGGDGKWTAEDGNKFVIDMDGDGGAHFVHGAAHGQNEFLQTMLALLMTPPKGMDIGYKYLGSGSVDGKPSNIIEVAASESSFKLFLDASTHLPQMISYLSHGEKMMMVRREKMTDRSNKDVELVKRVRHKSDKDQPVIEHQIKFSDFRRSGKLLMPHRWSHQIGGKQHNEIVIASFSVNPSNIDDKFKDEENLKMKIEKKSKS